MVLLLELCHAFLFAVSISSGSSNFRSMSFHEGRDSIPSGYLSKGPAPSNRILNLRLALAQSNITGLENVLYDISTPGSPKYRQHLTKTEADEFAKPLPQTISLLTEFLSSFNASTRPISSSGDWVQLTVPVSEANKMFDTDFTVFENVQSGREVVRTLNYSIPTVLKGHLNAVHPTVMFDDLFRQTPVISPINFSTSAPVPSLCSNNVIPHCLQALYNIPSTPATQPSNTVGVAGFMNQFALHSDLHLFLQSFRPDIPATFDFSVLSVDGGTNPQNQFSGSPMIDIEYIASLATGVPITFYTVGPNNVDGLSGHIDWLVAALQQNPPPTVMMSSINADEDDVSENMYIQFCNTAMQLGARGVTVLYASGSGGVGGSQFSPGPATCTTFVPAFPAGCPFITSVGATTGISPEIGANITAGGFSNVFLRPTYQLNAVGDYLSRIGSLNSGLFNRAGRGYPDISAQGVLYQVALDGFFGTVVNIDTGTPAIASIIALMNDQLIASGKQPMGFINPLLYSASGIAALNDITQGNNPGCNTDGFPAAIGWDPVTGLGTPDFQKLLAAVSL